MSEEAEKTLIPEDESADVLKETPVPEGVATEEKVGEQKNEAGKVSEERIRLENEAYEKHFAALREEIADIRKKYPVNPSDVVEDDPVKKLYGEVGELKNSFSELKELLQKPQQATPQNPNQGFQQGFQYQQAPQFFQQGPPQTYYPPMFQTSTILPAPALPFIQTPTYAPAITMPPAFGNNMSSNGGNNHG